MKVITKVSINHPSSTYYIKKKKNLLPDSPLLELLNTVLSKFRIFEN